MWLSLAGAAGDGEVSGVPEGVSAAGGITRGFGEDAIRAAGGAGAGDWRGIMVGKEFVDALTVVPHLGLSSG